MVQKSTNKLKIFKSRKKIITSFYTLGSIEHRNFENRDFESYVKI